MRKHHHLHVVLREPGSNIAGALSEPVAKALSGPEMNRAMHQLHHGKSCPQQCTPLSPMPPWVASAQRLSSLTKGRAIERLSPVIRCRNATPRSLNLRVRSASTHVSPTAINLRPNIPPRNKELYNALSALSGAAETYVNISRLQLALGGLAAQDAVTRVAGGFCHSAGRRS
jgi:hypothetical protein